MYFVVMSIRPLILLFLLLLSQNHPCQSAEGHGDEDALATGRADLCQEEKDTTGHPCCSSGDQDVPLDSDHQNHPCSANCSCVCCVPVLNVLVGLTAIHHPPHKHSLSSWFLSIHPFDVAHSIWQPPQMG